jgi:hypothetical protein
MAEVGRPSHYSNPGDLEAAIEEYFATIGTDPMTITGLAYHLGFESRQSLYDYEQKGEYSYMIKRARLKVEMGYEKALSGQMCTGSIFALKNMGWKDNQRTELTGAEGKDLIPINIIMPPGE